MVQSRDQSPHKTTQVESTHKVSSILLLVLKLYFILFTLISLHTIFVDKRTTLQYSNCIHFYIIQNGTPIFKYGPMTQSRD